MQKNICSTEEAEPPSRMPAALTQPHAGSAQHCEHKILPDINRCRLTSLTLVPVSRHLPENPQTLNFRNQFYPEVTANQWNNWRICCI